MGEGEQCGQDVGWPGGKFLAKSFEIPEEVGNERVGKNGQAGDSFLPIRCFDKKGREGFRFLSDLFEVRQFFGLHEVVVSSKLVPDKVGGATAGQGKSEGGFGFF